MNNKPNCCFCWCPPPLFLLSPRVVCVGLLLFLTSTAVACGPVGQFRFTKNSSNMVGISQTDQKIIDTRANDTRSLAKWRDCSEWFRKLKCMLGRKEGKRKQQHAGASLATTLTGKMFLYTEGALRKRTKKKCCLTATTHLLHSASFINSQQCLALCRGIRVNAAHTLNATQCCVNFAAY